MMHHLRLGWASKFFPRLLRIQKYFSTVRIYKWKTCRSQNRQPPHFLVMSERYTGQAPSIALQPHYRDGWKWEAEAKSTRMLVVKGGQVLPNKISRCLSRGEYVKTATTHRICQYNILVITVDNSERIVWETNLGSLLIFSLWELVLLQPNRWINQAEASKLIQWNSFTARKMSCSTSSRRSNI